MTVMPRPSILSVEPYVGGESKIPGVNRIVKLSSNEGAFGPPPGAVEAIRAMAAEAHRYPDGGAKALREAIGARFGLDPARIVVGNGSDELLALLILAYGGEGTELVMSAHGFMMYDITGRWAGCSIIKVPEKNLTTDVDGMLAAVGPRTRLMFLANPNNPTGSILPQAEVERLRAGLRDDVLLVLDSAYAEYVTRPDYDAGAKLVDASGSMVDGRALGTTVMTRTFSKIFGMGGMRLGWCYAPAEVIDVLGRVRGPFNVNAAAMAAGIAAWRSRAGSSNPSRTTPNGGRRWPAPSKPPASRCGRARATSCSPISARGAKAKAADDAMKQRGLIVRAMGGYGLPSCLRITIGTAEECTMVIEALTAFMAQHG